jgi:hypothetical protein
MKLSNALIRKPSGNGKSQKHSDGREDCSCTSHSKAKSPGAWAIVMGKQKLIAGHRPYRHQPKRSQRTKRSGKKVGG